MSTELELSVTRDGNAFAITANGESDLSNSQNLLAAARLALVSAECSAVNIDLASVSFIDSTSLSVLVIMNNECAQKGADFALHNLTRPVRRALTAAGLAGVLPIAPPDSTAT